MSSEILTLSDDTVLCEYAPLPGVRNFVTERVSVGPDLVALLIRDGQVAHVSHGAHIEIGGVWEGIKSSIGGRHALRLLIADLKPFPASALFTALTRDNVPVSGEVSLELQINPERPANVLALASDHAVVTKADVVARLAPHIGDRAMQAAVRAVDAGALRGDAGLQDTFQARAMEEAERVFGDMGLMVRAASINWAFNDEEIAAMERRNAERGQDMLDAKLMNLEREIKRSAAVTTLQLSTEADIETLRATSDHDLRQLILAQEAEFVDAKERAAQIQRMKALEGEIEEIKREQEAKFDLALGEARSEVDIKRIKVESHKLDLLIDRLTREQQVELKHLEEMNNIALAREAHALHKTTLTDLQEIELAGRAGNADIDDRSANSAHAREMERQRLTMEAEIARLQTQRDLTPDQILAAQAGLSPEVAAVFTERARTDNASSAEKMALMERLVQSGAQTGEQAKYFFEQFKEGVVGVAAGAGGGAKDRGMATILCPQCRAENAADAPFCQRCAAPLRA